MPGTITGAAQAVAYPCALDLCPTGISDTPLGGFPTEGGTYGILTTGNAALADDANVGPDSGYSWNTTNPTMGSTVYDWNTYRFDLVAATTSCLAFDFKFLSDEFPEFINSQFNDAFVAQLGQPAVTVDPTTGAVNAPGNFAAGAGDMISVNASGPSATSEALAAGTTYDGATAILTARVPVTPGTTNSLNLTLFDQGDSRYDSAVFVDNIRYETIDPKKCKSLALDPAEGTTGVTPVPGAKAALSKDKKTLSFPVSCDLPPGSFSCTVDGAATFLPSKGRNVSARDAAMLAGTPFAAGSSTIPANTNGAITMATTPKGLKALKSAIKKPAKLKKTANKLFKKAKKLRQQGQVAKAQKLEKKAKKLQERAKKLQKKPLGTVKITITNPSNGVSQSFKSVLKR